MYFDRIKREIYVYHPSKDILDLQIENININNTRNHERVFYHSKKM